MRILPGCHRLMAFITQLDLRALSYLVRFFRSVRIVAFQALSFCDRIVQVRFRVDALVARRAELRVGGLHLELVLIAGERRVADGAIAYHNRAVPVFVLDDIGMALLGNAAFRGIGVLLFLKSGGRCRESCGAQEDTQHQSCLQHSCVRHKALDPLYAFPLLVRAATRSICTDLLSVVCPG